MSITQATPRLIGVPDGAQIVTTMKTLHGPGMAGLTVAFVAALVGVFVMQSALEGDRRLVSAGFRPGETVIVRLMVLGTATLVVLVATAATALSFTPREPRDLGLDLQPMVWLVMDWATRRHHHELSSSPSAGEILDRRLASGEITPDEHDRVRKALGPQPRESTQPG